MDPQLEPFVRRKPADLRLLHAHDTDAALTCLAVGADADGQPLIAVGQADEAVILLLDASLAQVGSLSGHGGGTNSLAFGSSGSSSGSSLVSAGEDGTAAVWDVQQQQLCGRLACDGNNLDKTPDGHTVAHVACNADGSLAACAAGRTLHVFELGAGDLDAKRRVFPPVTGGVIEDVRFCGSRVLACFYGGVAIHGTQPGQPGIVLDYPTNVYSVAATPDLSYLVAGCMDTCINIWRFSPPLLQPGAGGSNGSSAPPGAAGTPQQDQQQQHATSQQQPPEVDEFGCGGFESKVTQMQFDPSGTLLATQGGTQTLVLDFGAAEGPGATPPVVALGHTKTLTCLAWQPLPNSKLLVTCGKDGRVLVYDISEATPGPGDDEDMPCFAAPLALAPNPKLRDEVTHVVWSGAERIYVAHSSGVVRCWQFEQPRPDAANGAGGTVPPDTAQQQPAPPASQQQET